MGPVEVQICPHRSRVLRCVNRGYDLDGGAKVSVNIRTPARVISGPWHYPVFFTMAKTQAYTGSIDTPPSPKPCSNMPSGMSIGSAKMNNCEDEALLAALSAGRLPRPTSGFAVLRKAIVQLVGNRDPGPDPALGGALSGDHRHRCRGVAGIETSGSRRVAIGRQEPRHVTDETGLPRSTLKRRLK